MAEIQGVANFTIYFSCVKCNKKVTASDSPVVRCDNWNMTQKKANCSSQCHLQCHIKTSTGKVTVTMFDDTIRAALQSMNGNNTDPQEENVTETLLNLPEVEISYNNTVKIVSNLKLPWTSTTNISKFKKTSQGTLFCSVHYSVHISVCNNFQLKATCDFKPLSFALLH